MYKRPPLDEYDDNYDPVPIAKSKKLSQEEKVIYLTDEEFNENFRLKQLK
jgi:hypothetical protein